MVSDVLLGLQTGDLLWKFESADVTARADVWSALYRGFHDVLFSDTTPTISPDSDQALPFPCCSETATS